MERSFIIATAVASALMFAGVWKVTAPAPVVAATSSPDTDSAPQPSSTSIAMTAPIAAPPARSSVAARSRRALVAEPYNVVRSAYGSTRAAGSVGSRAEGSVFYSGCREARAAEAAPIYRGQPGYRAGMDGDGDGIACEPYR